LSATFKKPRGKQSDHRKEIYKEEQLQTSGPRIAFEQKLCKRVPITCQLEEP